DAARNEDAAPLDRRLGNLGKHGRGRAFEHHVGEFGELRDGNHRNLVAEAPHPLRRCTRVARRNCDEPQPLDAAIYPFRDDAANRAEAADRDRQLISRSCRHIPSQRAFALSSMAWRRTPQPAARSSGFAFSASLWLMPPSQGTKIIAVGATRAM